MSLPTILRRRPAVPHQSETSYRAADPRYPFDTPTQAIDMRRVNFFDIYNPRMTMVRIVAIVPAWNSGLPLADTIAGLRVQTRPPDRIIIVVNNSTDDGLTERVARESGAEVLVMTTPHKKAGALNYVLERELPGLCPDDLVLVTDDDTTMNPQWIERACRYALDRDRPCYAVGAVFRGRPNEPMEARGLAESAPHYLWRRVRHAGTVLLGDLQRGEYERFASSVGHRNRNALVLSGTATLFRVDGLVAVHEALRDGQLKGSGYVYNTDSITEDNYLTLSLHVLGMRTTSPHECDVVTDVIGTVVGLWHQRYRWQFGTLCDYRTFGWFRPVTREGSFRQLVQALLIVVNAVYFLGFVPYGVATQGPGFMNPLNNKLFLAIGLFIIFERAWTVRRLGIKSMLLAATLVVELGMDVFRQAVYVAAMWAAIRRPNKQIKWVNT